MSLDYINEAFRTLDLLTEDVFRADAEGINELSDFMSSDVDNEDKISIIDMDAESEDDLQDSYIGKVIADCNVCHSHIFKDKNDIVIDEDGVVNSEDECPYCGEQGGFVIIGEIHEFKPADEEEAEETPEEEVEVPEETPIEEAAATEELIEESLTEAVTLWDELVKDYPELEGPVTEGFDETESKESLEEAFKNVSLETEDQIMTMTSEDNGKVTVTTEPVEATLEGEVIAPVSDETENDIISANAEVVDDESTKEDITDELDVDFSEIDDESMSDLGESYLKKVYENVDSFKLTNCSTTPNQLIMEGIITFKSGTKKNTGFIFEAKDATRDGKVRFIGENAHLCRGRKAFTLVGSVNESKKLVCESFTYNYRAKNANGKSTRVYGKVNRNK